MPWNNRKLSLKCVIAWKVLLPFPYNMMVPSIQIINIEKKGKKRGKLA